MKPPETRQEWFDLARTLREHQVEDSHPAMRRVASFVEDLHGPDTLQVLVTLLATSPPEELRERLVELCLEELGRYSSNMDTFLGSELLRTLRGTGGLERLTPSNWWRLGTLLLQGRGRYDTLEVDTMAACADHLGAPFLVALAQADREEPPTASAEAVGILRALLGPAPPPTPRGPGRAGELEQILALRDPQELPRAVRLWAARRSDRVTEER